MTWNHILKVTGSLRKVTQGQLSNKWLSRSPSLMTSIWFKTRGNTFFFFPSMKPPDISFTDFQLSCRLVFPLRNEVVNKNWWHPALDPVTDCRSGSKGINRSVKRQWYHILSYFFNFKLPNACDETEYRPNVPTVNFSPFHISAAPIICG